MALRTIRVQGDPVLEKVCKPVTEITPRISELIEDMLDTMYDANGVGLAAPQVGVLRRVVLVDNGEKVLELINPEIIATEGEQTGTEGCLSLPDQCGIVTRPMVVTVRAQDRNGETFEYTGEGLTARCFCHELDHLDGILYPERASKMLTDEELAEMAGDEEEE